MWLISWLNFQWRINAIALDLKANFEFIPHNIDEFERRGIGTVETIGFKAIGFPKNWIPWTEPTKWGHGSLECSRNYLYRFFAKRINDACVVIEPIDWINQGKLWQRKKFSSIQTLDLRSFDGFMELNLWLLLNIQTWKMYQHNEEVIVKKLPILWTFQNPTFQELSKKF